MVIDAGPSPALTRLISIAASRRSRPISASRSATSVGGGEPFTEMEIGPSKRVMRVMGRPDSIAKLRSRKSAAMAALLRTGALGRAAVNLFIVAASPGRAATRRSATVVIVVVDVGVQAASAPRTATAARMRRVRNEGTISSGCIS
jgi:hypothetical protein